MEVEIIWRKFQKRALGVVEWGYMISRCSWSQHLVITVCRLCSKSRLYHAALLGLVFKPQYVARTICDPFCIDAISDNKLQYSM